ncbi:tRNA preQ1(34) S-adenosylmethionine ribosyltransferase-isomerase QueA [Candidatus Microgenomates bacterium]|nr:MAG: tRNA preQ1(34) S-adenosylmethionine ribosyltransferase-isomerase QueA [Candidatus Microgenomates bacterium]
MEISKFDYTLPKNLIANAPASPRDSSRLMTINRKTKSIYNKHFYDLIDMFSDSDCLVLNDTKVYPARLFGKRKTGGQVEVLLVNNLHKNVWEILGRNVPSVNQEFNIDKICAKVLEKTENKTVIEFANITNGFDKFLEKHGHTPIPPYIHTKFSEAQLRKKYQTKYARETGSIAAPTAGLHFTNRITKGLLKRHVQIEYVTLHVGLGTFLPVKSNTLEEHSMHSESFSVTRDTVERLNIAKKSGKRIIAVGTTTIRVLESLANNNSELRTNNLSSDTDIFIYPPYKFEFVDALITNFHLPKSTLLALVAAFVSHPNTNDKFVNFNNSLIGKAYKKAIKNNYRFYSFGDAMIIE